MFCEPRSVSREGRTYYLASLLFSTEICVFSQFLRKKHTCTWQAVCASAYFLAYRTEGRGRFNVYYHGCFITFYHIFIWFLTVSISYRLNVYETTPYITVIFIIWQGECITNSEILLSPLQAIFNPLSWQ